MSEKKFRQEIAKKADIDVVLSHQQRYLADVGQLEHKMIVVESQMRQLEQKTKSKLSMDRLPQLLEHDTKRFDS